MPRIVLYRNQVVCCHSSLQVKVAQLLKVRYSHMYGRSCDYHSLLLCHMTGLVVLRVPHAGGGPTIAPPPHDESKNDTHPHSHDRTPRPPLPGTLTTPTHIPLPT